MLLLWLFDSRSACSKSTISVCFLFLTKLGFDVGGGDLV